MQLVRALSLDGIKGRIVVFAVLAALVPTMMTAMIAYANNKRALTNQITETLQTTSSQTARELALWFDDRLRDLRVFASSYEVTENVETMSARRGDTTLVRASRLRLTNYLAVLEEQFPDYSELAVLDDDHRLLTASGDGGTSLLQAIDWLTSVRGEAFVVGGTFTDEERGQVLRVAVPVRATDGRFLGALAAQLNLGAARAIMSNFAPDDAGRLHLTDARGTTLLSSASRIGGAADAALGDGAIRAVREGRTGPVRYVDAAGDEILGAIRWLPQLNWVVIAEVLESRAFAQVARLRNLTVFVVTLLLFAVGFIAYRLALLIVRPLDRLTKGAAEVARGDLAVDLPVVGGGEVGYLTSVFNNMVSRLREGHQKLDAINETLRLKNEELERLSIIDGLTGLVNRRHLMDTLDHEARRTRRSKHSFSILMVDVDHFKELNDTYGHQFGDEVLVRISSILTHTVREVDTAGRYGGEEFVLLLPDTDASGAQHAAERIRECLARGSISVRGQEISVTVSIGVAEFPRDGETAGTLLAAADGALYDAKRNGRNQVSHRGRRIGVITSE